MHRIITSPIAGSLDVDLPWLPRMCGKLDQAPPTVFDAQAKVWDWRCGWQEVSDVPVLAILTVAIGIASRYLALKRN